LKRKEAITMRKGEKIRIRLGGNRYWVTILKIREELPGGWFLKVKFGQGAIRDLGVNRHPIYTTGKEIKE